MIPLDTAIAGQVTIAFYFAGVARVACLWLASFPLCADDSVDFGLREIGDGTGHVGGRSGFGSGSWN